MTAPQPELQYFPLRPDLDLIPHGRNSDGAPIYTIHDPVLHKFYRISWLEFEILYRWGLQDPKKIIQDIRHKTTLRPTEDDVTEMHLFLNKHQLLSLSAYDLRMFHAQEQQAAQKNLTWLIKNYLFFRIRLIRPDRALKKMVPATNWLFTRGFLISMIFLAMIGLYLVLREWASFKTGLSIIQTPTGMVMTFFALAFAKMLHEFGHGIACRHYGCHVPNMGVAFIVMWPILWTDTTDAWRLKSHKKRLVIDSAGMIAELSLAAITSILWALSPDGTSFKMAMQLLAGTTWIMTLFVNLNPFMRFDGYYIASDLFNFPNLQERSFKLARQYMRQFLWGIPPKLDHPYGRRQIFWLCAYAFGTWIYRFFLFLGIALLVYHFFFKSLGMILMMIELYWFIAKPVLHELKEWPKLVKMMPQRRHAYMTLLCCAGLIALCTLPLQRSMTLPAILKSATETPILTSHAGQIEFDHTLSKTAITKGDLIFKIRAPELEQQIIKATTAYQQLSQEHKQQATSQKYYQYAQEKAQELAKTQAELTALRNEQAQLIYHAPHDGFLYDVPDHLTNTSWVSDKEFVALLGSTGFAITAYINEQELRRLQSGAKAEFYFQSHIAEPIPAHVTEISQTAISHLEDTELSSQYKGDIKAQEDADGLLKTQEGIYKIRLTLDTTPSDLSARYLGYIVVDAAPQSFAYQYIRKAISIFRREFGAW